MVDTPTPETVAAGSSVLASKWNTHVRNLAEWTVANIAGVGARNGLYNSHFDIWQRGTSFAITSSATPQYTADRWCVRRSGATGATVSRQAAATGQQYVMRVQRDSGNANTTAIEAYQALDTPDSVRFAGTSCQLRIRLKAGSNFSAASSAVTIKVVTGEGTNEAPAATWTGSNDALSVSQAISAVEDDYIFDGIDIPWDATQVKVYVAFTPVGTASTNDWIEVSAVQLVEGSAPGWERLPVGEHLRRCQRYYQQIGPYGAARVVAGSGQAASTTVAFLSIPLPTTMRTTPAVTFSAGNDFTVNGSVNTTNMAVDGMTTASVVMVAATCAAVLTPGFGMYLTNNQDTTNAAIYVSAEL